jgi:hypothetical protein
MSDGHTTPIFVSEAQAAKCLKDGMTVRLIYNETERWEGEEGQIIGSEDGESVAYGMVVVEVEPQDCDDDGLRECGWNQIVAFKRDDGTWVEQL